MTGKQVIEEKQQRNKETERKNEGVYIDNRQLDGGWIEDNEWWIDE